jgi:hypothetical protein
MDSAQLTISPKAHLESKSACHQNGEIGDLGRYYRLVVVPGAGIEPARRLRDPGF